MVMLRMHDEDIQGLQAARKLLTDVVPEGPEQKMALASVDQAVRQWRTACSICDGRGFQWRTGPRFELSGWSERPTVGIAAPCQTYHASGRRDFESSPTIPTAGKVARVLAWRTFVVVVAIFAVAWAVDSLPTLMTQNALTYIAVLGIPALSIWLWSLGSDRVDPLRYDLVPDRVFTVYAVAIALVAAFALVFAHAADTVHTDHTCAGVWVSNPLEACSTAAP